MSFTKESEERGGADSYYRRKPRPHYRTGNGLPFTEVTEADMTPEEIEAYHKGYRENDGVVK